MKKLNKINFIRSQECLEVALSSLSQNIVTVFARKNNHKQTKKSVIEKVEIICNEFMSMIYEVNQILILSKIFDG